MGNRICWIKLNGWPDSFNERLYILSKKVDHILVIKPKNNDESTEPAKSENIDIINLWPARDPVVKPRIKLAFYPIWIIEAVLLYLLYRVFEDEVDIFHSIDYPFSAITAKILSTITGRPRIASVRGLIATQFDERERVIPGIKNKLARITLKFINGFSITGADYIITKAEYQQQYLNEKYGLPKSIMVSIPTGVDFSKFDPDSLDEKRTKHEVDSIISDIPDDVPIILQLGQAVRRKGADLFIQNAISYDGPECHFLLVGETQTDDFDEELNNYLQEYSGDNISFINSWVNFGDVPYLIHAIDVVCLLSRPGHEGVPRVLQEGCAMGKPLVASDVLGIKGFFGSMNSCFLINQNSSGEFNDAITNAINTDVNREGIRSELSIEENYSKYAEIYSKVANL